ncbi:hypothetical protein [Rhodovulum visakhapatnamense]|uniref:Sulfotransferase family protein n=1 Tax=Rhodovulum visakhapatnamense TaxID=364297 RepID=A0ABS1RNC7_9RHOB|nr:hypothetical protein [Rhodovulum visakhapatnamense]MBL3571765.1 hypothetical protein [Rhodovulum visakhapatnamense]MBL3580186.1 hypothetical protein [Rhodovulum visakhapatnamense]
MAGPDPRSYRPVLREMPVALRGAPATDKMQTAMLQAALEGATAERLVLTNPSFLCMPQKALAQHMLYPMAGEKAHWLAQLFPGARPCFLSGLRNPAIFVPALFALPKERDLAAFIAGTDPVRPSWKDPVQRIRNALPGAELTVWCNEDTPLIRPDVMQVAASGGATDLAGGDAVLAKVITPAGLARLNGFLADSPALDPAARRRAAFLDKYAIPEAVEEETDLPGWADGQIETRTDRYAEDIAAIAAMPGIRFLAA